MKIVNKNKKIKVSVIIPVYNESENIAPILTKLQQKDIYEIIVVDDGSEDDTAKKVLQFKEVLLLKNPYNIGNGASIKKGIKRSRGDIVICMDGDRQHDPNDIPKLLKYISSYDMVIGARKGLKDLSKIRFFGNWGLKKIAEFLSGHKIGDLTSGFRAIDREKIIELLHLLPNRYSYPTTSVLAFLSSGYTIKYVNLESIKKRTKGKSNINPIRDGLRFINIMLRIFMIFNPQRIFIPISILFLIVGLILGARSIILFHKIIQSSAIMIIIAVIIFLFGLLADQMSVLIRKPRR